MVVLIADVTADCIDTAYGFHFNQIGQGCIFKYDNPLLGANAIAYCIDTVELHLLLLLQIEGATATDWMCC